MFRRMRRFLVRQVINPGGFQDINRANQLLSSGQPEQAAGLYVQLAEQRQAAGRLRQAANLHAQAAHAWLDAGAAPHALHQARLAMGLFRQLGMRQRDIEFRTRFPHRLRELQQGAAADGFEQEFGLPEESVAGRASPSRRGQLPGICPQCGAPLRSDTVDWIDDRSAECDFCGATILAEA